MDRGGCCGFWCEVLLCIVVLSYDDAIIELFGFKMRFNYWIYVAILSGLGGCAAPSDVMIRPSDGATVRCSSKGLDFLAPLLP